MVQLDLGLDTVAVPRDLAERVLAALRASLTGAGHLAQKVGHEHLGYCSWRAESERCVAMRRVIDEMTRAMEDV